MTERLSIEQVRHVARLARLRLDDPQAEQFRTELQSILLHLARLGQVDVSGVEPMAHPGELTNRLADDEPVDPMPVRTLLGLAPAVEGEFIAVPKVL